MTRRISTSFVVCLGLACLAINPACAAEKKAKEGELNGRVQMIEKDKSTIVVRKGTTQRHVIYNSDTKWIYGTQTRNKPSSFDELKEDWYINCKGTFDGVKLVASACRFRESK